ncbi:MAG: tetratricopeptide repeat protein [Candidatus Aminicenantes bacterium]|nr:tetratricopeptide repeat protein [Candidatus Aminicenantes bacterium]
MHELLGTRISHYRIVDFLDHGGMGDLYVGFDEKLKRKVALKSIKAEHKLMAESKARFLREARVLSKLAHPNICQIFDYLEGHTTDFLVLELITGRKLSEMIRIGMDHHQKLKVAEQLAGVLVVAHEQDIIHRDLKPDNIMVDENGQVKVLDFGLSRSRQDELTLQLASDSRGKLNYEGFLKKETGKNGSSAKLTQIGMVMGTIQYMSPEQARGEDATTAGDLYSFGLILQELFTGKPAYEDNINFRTLVSKAAVGDTLPIAGIDTTLAALITRLKSLAPAARPTAVDAAEKLAWIRNKPVRRRKKILFTAAVGVLVFFALAMTLQTMRAVRAEKTALAESAISKQVSGFLVSLFKVSDPSEARGNSITAREILDRGAEKIETELKGQSLVQARLMDAMGNVYVSLGLYNKAEILLEKALGIREKRLQRDHPDVATALNNLALLYKNQGRYKEAEPLYRRALAIREKTLGASHADVATSLNNLASLFQHQGLYALAEPLYQRALSIRRSLISPDHPDVAELLNNLALLYYARGQYERTEPLFKEALAIWEHAIGPDHPDLAISLNNLAALYFKQSRYAAAAPLFQRSLAIKQKALGPNHPDVATSLNNLAMLYRAQGQYADAEALFRQSLAIREKALGPGHPEVARIQYNLGRLLNEQKRFVEAEVMLRRALNIYSRTAKVNPQRVAETLNECAQLLRRTQRSEEAKVLEARAQALIDKQNHLQDKP